MSRNDLVATGWAVGGLNPGGGEIFHTRSKRPTQPSVQLVWVIPVGTAAGEWR
jgi:hypothetical protein